MDEPALVRRRLAALSAWQRGARAGGVLGPAAPAVAGDDEAATTLAPPVDSASTGRETVASRRALLSHLARERVAPSVGGPSAEPAPPHPEVPAGRRPEAAPRPTPPPPETAPGPAPPATGIAGRLARLRRSVGLDTAGPPDAPRPAPETPPSTPPHRAHARWADALGGEAVDTPHGEVWRIHHHWPGAERHGDRPLDGLFGRDLALIRLLGGLAPERPITLPGLLFLDLECSGLATNMGTLPFLIGLAWYAPPGAPGVGWITEQWLLRTPDEEEAALSRVAERLAEADALVTFNGRCYDAPLLRARLRLHRLDPDALLPPGHIDLLPPSRRLLADALPNARLATLETHRLGVHRHEDVPGSEVPARYLRALAEDDPAPLRDVVAHNRDDVLSMITLLDLLLDRIETADSLVLRDPRAALAIAIWARRAGDLPRARAIYEAAAAFPDTAEAGRAGLRRLDRAAGRSSDSF